MNIFYVTDDFISLDCGSMLSSDSELNNHILRYHKKV
jgi:hypothetical protein